MGDTSDDRDTDEEEENEEAGGSRLLGFMFGNVDNSGELDVDYLDEDAKEHLDALADLEPALTAINLAGKSSKNAYASEEGYNEKAADAVDYEDIDEQYEGPEIETTNTEEDHLLPKSEYTPSDVLETALEHKSSVFDDENYDEDEDYDQHLEVKVDDTEVHSAPSPGLVSLPECNEKSEIVDNNSDFEAIKSPVAQDYVTVLNEEIGPDDLQHQDSFGTQIDAEDVVNDEEAQNQEEALGIASKAPLPVLCFDNGNAILRFSEIFGVHKPLRKAERRERGYLIRTDKYTSADVPYIVEEDEDNFLKDPCQGFSTMSTTVADDLSSISDDNAEISDSGLRQATQIQSSDRKRGSFISAEPLNGNCTLDLSLDWKSDISPKFYPLDQLDWEDEIIWGNSPTRSNDDLEDCDLSGTDSHTASTATKENDASKEKVGDLRKTKNLDTRKDGVSEGHQQISFFGRFNKLAIRNDDLEEGSWLEKIIWEPENPIPKPKLILDLQDEFMLFEVSDDIDHNLLQLHARALIIARPAKTASVDSFELRDLGGFADGRFNIANDKFYSNRKTSPQLKSISKKRTAHGVKILHSIPALKLQTMKPKLSNKDIANFHRPKAVWYPHDYDVAAKEQEKLPTQGPMKIILKSLGGKGSKMHVDAEETISSVKSKAAKKLDLKPSEEVRIFYSGRELEDHKTLADQNVRPNSLLHLVRTKIHPLVTAQRYIGENKSLRPPGAFKKKSDLSVKDGHVFLMEYFEERPLLLGNVGMGARLCTYYQKLSSDDQTGDMLRNSDSGLGTVLTLDPADKSPFLGDINPGGSQSSLETNMCRAPVFPHRVASSDYLLVRSAKGKLSIRRIDKIHVVGQQEPHMEVMSPLAKGLQPYQINRLLVYTYREFQAAEKRGVATPYIPEEELAAQFPYISDAIPRKRMRQCADLQQKRPNDQLRWAKRRNFHIPSEEEIRRMVTPENVCAYESMQAGLHRLKRLGITRLQNLTGPTQLAALSSAMNQLPYEAIALFAASHIERELQITPWNLSSNFVACTSQDKENIERLEITGIGDPSGRGLGFSYVRLPPKAPIANTAVKKKPTVVKGSTVTGTDADLRRLSMDAAREVLLKFNVPDEQIAKLTRWHRIALIRKLSSEQAASGVEVDSMAISKFARGQRMSFLQLQQQTRDKCQEIWDRQVQTLSAVDGDENESDSEAHSDLDSFAGDLENLLDAEECEETEDNNLEFKPEKCDTVRGLKMRRHSSEAQSKEEFEDEAAEAAELRRLLMDDDDVERKGKRKAKPAIKKFVTQGLALNRFQTPESHKKKKHKSGLAKPGDSFAAKQMESEPYFKGTPSIKVKPARSSDVPFKKAKLMPNGEKKERKPARETFICGACGQEGHMRTNKNCPKYGKDPEVLFNIAAPDTPSEKAISLEPLTQSQQKPSHKKAVIKAVTKVAPIEVPEVEKSSAKPKSLKVKCNSVDSKITPVSTPVAEQPTISESETGSKPLPKVNKLKFIATSKKKPEVVVQAEPPKPIPFIPPPIDTSWEQPRQKVTIKQPKQVHILDQTGVDASVDTGFRKTKKIVDLTSPVPYMRPDVNPFGGEGSKGRSRESRRALEEEKRRNAERVKEENARRIYMEEMRMLEEQDHQLAKVRRYEEVLRIEREEEALQKAQKKKKKKKRDEFEDDYLEDYQFRRNSRGIPERERSAKKKTVVESGRYTTDHLPPTKRRRGGEVSLANILESIVEALKARRDISYLFLKPVSKKEAPDYLDIIGRPMDLSTIRDRTRRLEYKDRKEFRHDVWQIAYNAHLYNEGRNPGIPPLAQKLLDLCDIMLEQNDVALADAESSIADL